MNYKVQGFTLIELMVTLAIFGVAVSIAVPSFRTLVADTRLTGQANDLLGSLKYTRSEAVKRNARVTMCKSNGGTACTTAGNWQAGWIVFVDGGVAAAVDTGDEMLQVHGAVADSTVVGDGNIGDYVSYLGNGQTSTAAGASQAGAISLCASLAGARRRKIDVTKGSGWVGVRTVAAATICSAI